MALWESACRSTRATARPSPRRPRNRLRRRRTPGSRRDLLRPVRPSAPSAQRMRSGWQISRFAIPQASARIPRLEGHRGLAPPRSCALEGWCPPRPVASRRHRLPRTPLGSAPVQPPTARERGQQRCRRRQNDAQHRPLQRQCCWRGLPQEMFLIGKRAMRAGTCRGANRGRQKAVGAAS